MKDVLKVIETLRAQLERHKHSGLKEYPTRTIFIDPLLFALGWDVRDPDEVERLRAAEKFLRESFDRETRRHI